MDLDVTIKLEDKSFRDGKGTLLMAFADTTATIKRKGKEAGEVVCGIGAVIEVNIEDDNNPNGFGYIYRIGPLELWQAVYEAHKRSLEK